MNKYKKYEVLEGELSKIQVVWSKEVTELNSNNQVEFDKISEENDKILYEKEIIIKGVKIKKKILII